MLKEIVAPFITHSSTTDMNALISHANAKKLTQRLSFDWMNLANFIPTRLTRTMFHLAAGVFRLSTLSFKRFSLEWQLAFNNSLQTLGFTAALMPSYPGNLGLRLVKWCQVSERTLALRDELQNLKEYIKYRSVVSDDILKECFDFYNELEEELNQIGYLKTETITQLHEKEFPVGIVLDNKSLILIASLAYCIHPDQEKIKKDFPALNDVDQALFPQNDPSEVKPEPYAGQPSKEEMEAIFSVIHGDFTGSELSIPNAKPLIGYLHAFAQSLTNGDHPIAKEVFGSADKKLPILERRLKTTLEFQEFRKGMKPNQTKQFVNKLAQKLQQETDVTLPSGYAKYPAGHRIYLDLHLETRNGKQWVSGVMSNRGEGTGHTQHLDHQGRKRIFPEIILKPAPLEAVKSSHFWQLFLELDRTTGKTGDRSNFSIDDIRNPLLSAWPGGFGHSQATSKPQYSGTCQFKPLTNVIKKILGKKEGALFLILLYEKSLTDYVQAHGVTSDNVYDLEEILSHLARRMHQVAGEVPVIAEATIPKLDDLRVKIETFKSAESSTLAEHTLPIDKATYANNMSSNYCRVDNPTSSPSSLVRLNPPKGDLVKTLNYYIEKSWPREFNLDLCVARKGLQQLPSVNDPIWLGPKSDELRQCVHHLALIFKNGLARNSPRGNIHPDDAALFFKFFMIQFKSLFSKINNPELKKFYLSRIKGVLESDSLNLFRPTNPNSMRDLAETAEFIKKSTTNIQAANNVSFMKLSATNLNHLKDYPHLNVLKTLFETHTDFKEKIQKRLTRLDQNHNPIKPSDLECIAYIYKTNKYAMPDNWEQMVPELVDYDALQELWLGFFGLFGLNHSCSHDLTNGGRCYGVEKIFGGYQFYESFNSIPGYIPFPSDDEEKNKQVQSNLFAKTYPGFKEEESHVLLPLLKKEHPFASLDKKYENEHLLHASGLEVCGERLPFYEVQNLLSLTTYKDLSIDLITSHFDRFFTRLKSAPFQSLLHALFVQVFYDKGETHNLLSHATQHHPEQIERLLEFLQKRRSDAQRLHWHETAAYLFWLEGVVISYFVRGGGPKANVAYEDYLKSVQYSLEHPDMDKPENIFGIGTKVFSLIPYFEGSPQKDHFFAFVKNQIGSPQDSTEEHEKFRIHHAYRLFNGDLQKQKSTQHKKTVTIPYPGIYTHNPEVGFDSNIHCPYFPFEASFDTNIHGSASPFPVGWTIESQGWNFYENKKTRRGLLYKDHKGHPEFLVEHGKIMNLKDGELTGFSLDISKYPSNEPIYEVLSRLSLPRDLYLWKDEKDQVTYAELRSLNLSFHYEEGCWMSSRHPGYYLDPNDRCALFEPASQYVVLRNHEGKRLIYILDAPSKKTGNDLLRRNENHPMKKAESTLLTYHLENGKIDFSQVTAQEILFGLYIATQSKNYQAASLWLKQWEKQKPLHNADTVRIYKYFTCNPSRYRESDQVKHPHSVAIRLKLGLSLLNDPLYTLESEEEKSQSTLWKSIFDKEFSLKDEVIINLVKDRENYFSQQNNTFPFALSKEELKQLDSLFLPREMLTHYDRFGHIAEEAFKDLKPPETANLSIADIKFDQAHLENAEALDFLYRPGKPFLQNFFLYYHLAKTLDPSDTRIDKLHHLLDASKYDPSNEVKICRQILKTVLSSPWSFPSTEMILLQKKETSVIFKELRKISTGLIFAEQFPEILHHVLYKGLPWLKDAMVILLGWLSQQISHDWVSTIAALYVISKLVFKVPSSALFGLGELCSENLLFNLFFRSMVSMLLFPPVNHFIKHVGIGARVVTGAAKRWIWSPAAKSLLSPSVPAKLFKTVAEFNSPSQSLLERLVNEQETSHSYFLTEKCDISHELATLDDIEKTFTVSEKQEKCVGRKYNQLLQGAKEKRAELVSRVDQPVYRINPAHLKGLIDELSNRRTSLLQTASKKEKSVFNLAHQYPDQLKLEVHGDMIKPLDMGELIIAFGRDDDARILKSNPSLSPEDVARIKSWIGEYLVAKREEMQLAKALGILTKALGYYERAQANSNKGYWQVIREKVWDGPTPSPEEDRIEMEALLKESVSLLEGKRNFVVANHPELLVFEYYSNFYLRNEQINLLEKFTNSGGDPKILEDLLAEAPTGFGKSKAVIPLWLLLTAKKGRLPMITVPEPLVEEMRVHLTKLLGKCSDNLITVIEFDRTRANDLKYLHYLHRQFQEAVADEKCLVMSINSLHGLSILKHKETYFKLINEGTPSSHLEALDKIRVDLKELISNFVDEASECFYIRYSYDYSVGKQEGLPNPYIEATGELFELLLNDEALRSKIDFDFLKSTNEDTQQIYISKENYHEEIAPHLIEKVIQYFKVPEEFKGAVTTNLKGEYDPKIDPFLDTLNYRQKEKYAIWHKQIVTFLRQSLTCRWNERYKLGNERIASPARNGRLIPRSQFSSLDLVLNFTLQANLKTPFTDADIDQYIEKLIVESTSQSAKMFRSSKLFQAYQTFTEDLGDFPHFFDLQRSHKRKILDVINGSLENRLRFIKTFILPKIEYFPKKIVSFPHLVCNRTGQTQGASGTLIENVPKRFNMQFDRKALFKNLLTLWHRSQDDVFSIPKLEGEALVHHLFKQFQNNFDVIIDVAGYFRGFNSNFEIAQALLKATASRNPPIDAICYFDEKGRKMVLTRKSPNPVLRKNASITKEKIFTFYSQEYAIGSDVDLKRSSHALVTAGRFTRSDFFMQGIGRLRGLNTGQKASIITIKEEQDFIRSAKGLPKNHKLQLRDLFRYFFDIEAEKQADEAFDVMTHEWTSQLEELFWNVDLDLTLADRLNLFEKLSPLFEKEVFSHPIHALRQTKKEMDVDQAITMSADKLLATLEKIIKENPSLASRFPLEKLKEKFLKEFESQEARERLRENFVLNGDSDIQLSFSEVAQEEESDQVDEELHAIARDFRLNFSPLEPKDWAKHYTDLSQHRYVSDLYPTHKEHLSNNLLCSSGYFKIDTSWYSKLHKMTLKPARYSLVVHDRQTDQFKMVLLDLHDAQFVLRQMEMDQKAGRRHSTKQNFYLIGTRKQTLMASNATDPWTDKMSEKPAFRKLMMQARPYTGELNFNKEELDDLENKTKKEREAYFQSIESRFKKIWPYYPAAIGNLSKNYTM